MCEELVKLVGIKITMLINTPTKDDGNLAILLSESKVEIDSIPVKSQFISPNFLKVLKNRF